MCRRRILWGTRFYREILLKNCLRWDQKAGFTVEKSPIFAFRPVSTLLKTKCKPAFREFCAEKPARTGGTYLSDLYRGVPLGLILLLADTQMGAVFYITDRNYSCAFQRHTPMLDYLKKYMEDWSRYFILEKLSLKYYRFLNCLQAVISSSLISFCAKSRQYLM